MKDLHLITTVLLFTWVLITMLQLAFTCKYGFKNISDGMHIVHALITAVFAVALYA